MERNFTNENFERFLQQNTDGLRMRPSAKVWKGISSHLNKRRRRIAFILCVSLLLTSGLGYYLIDESGNRKEIVSKAEQLQQKDNGKPSVDLNPGRVTVATANNDHRTTSKSSKAGNSQFLQKPGSLANGLIATNSPVAGSVSAPEFTFTPAVVDSYFENHNQEVPSEWQQSSAVDPFTIESVINSYQQRKKSKIGLQVYFTPTASYRKLSDNNIDYIAPSKPSFGFEAGLAAKYPIAKNIKARAGFQFNVNSYESKTNYSYTEMATIRLNDRNGVDFVQTSTNFNNFSGYKTRWLKSFYFQVSAPVGVEIKLTGNNRTQFGIATTVQPTYLLGDRAYLLSTDYKNYAEVPDLVRRWNVNTNLETFVTYSTGQLQWQVGPQVRYQLLSSYLKKYPVKQNLFDFGFKVGISLNNQ